MAAQRPNCATAMSIDRARSASVADRVLLGQRVDFARTNMKKHDRIFSHEVVRAMMVGMDVCRVSCSYRSMS
jgi:hypothetical protein